MSNIEEKQIQNIKSKIDLGEKLTQEEIKILEEHIARSKPKSLLEKKTLTNSEKLRDFINRIGKKEYITTYVASRMLGFSDKESFVNYITLKGIKPITTFDEALHFGAWKLQDITKYMGISRLEQEIATIKVIEEQLLPQKEKELSIVRKRMEKLEPGYHQLMSKPESKQKLYTHIIENYNEARLNFEEKRRELKRLKRIVELAFKKIQELTIKKSQLKPLSKRAEQYYEPTKEIPEMKNKFKEFLLPSLK